MSNTNSESEGASSMISSQFYFDENTDNIAHLLEDVTPAIETPESAPSSSRPSSSCSILSETPKRKGRVKKHIQNTSVDEQNELLQAIFVRNRPESLPPPPSPPKDNLDHFFESIANTMRTFSPLAIAKIKLQISQIVGYEEISIAERHASSHHIECAYVDNAEEPETLKKEVNMEE